MASSKQWNSDPSTNHLEESYKTLESRPPESRVVRRVSKINGIRSRCISDSRRPSCNINIERIRAGSIFEAPKGHVQEDCRDNSDRKSGMDSTAATSSDRHINEDSGLSQHNISPSCGFLRDQRPGTIFSIAMQILRHAKVPLVIGILFCLVILIWHTTRMSMSFT